MTLKTFRTILFLIVAFSLHFNVTDCNAAADHDTISAGNLRFEENKGQWGKQIAFKAELPCGALFLEKSCLTYAFYDSKDMNRILEFKHAPVDFKKELKPEDYLMHGHAYKVHFVDANMNARFQTSKPSEDYSNYFVGSDPSGWASSVRNYDDVTYQEIYAGIDLKLLQKAGNLKYEFYIHPGANPASIKLLYEGADNVSVDNGNLLVKTSVIDIIELKPVAYQIINGVSSEISCRYKLKGQTVSFEFPEGYDKNAEVIIDPVLIFSTYTGSTADNWGFTATYDAHGRVYSGGIVFGTGYPVSIGAYQTSFGGGETGAYLNGCDNAIIKYDSSGTQRLFATYLGGARNDLPHSMIVDANNNLLVYGTTGSSDYPVTANAYDATFNGGDSINYDYNSIKFSQGIDIFVSKISPDGTQLLASTYLGGTENDGLNYPSPLSFNYADGARGEISYDVNNNIYIVSTTNSTDFPVTAGVFQPLPGGGTQDGIVIKMDNNLTSIIWSSYLGGDGNDAVYSIVLDNNQNIYVTGGTNSNNFPVTPGVLKPAFQGGIADGFITHISKNGDLILQSTYFGSTAYDQTYFIENDQSGNIYTFGQTSATGSTWIYNAAWYITGGGQFISKISATLDTLIWSTAFGTGNGGPDISPTAFLVDLCDKIYLSGWGSLNLNGFGGTAGLPLTGNAYQTTTDGHDFYFLVMNDDASGIFYGTFFGGGYSMEHVDGGTSRFDRSGKIYQSVCAGCGGWSDFPTTTNAWSNTNNSSNCNNGVIKFDFMLPIIVADFDLPPVICAPGSTTFNNTTYDGGPGFTSHWNFGDGTTSDQFEPSHLYTTSGTYYVTLVVSDTGTCNFADSITKPILVLSNSTNLLADEHVCLGEYVQIGIPPTGDPTITYIWSPSATLLDPTISNPIASPTTTTTYTALVSNGICTDTLWQTVIVHDLNAWIHGDTATCLGTITLTANSSDGANVFHWSSNPDFTDWLNANPSDSTVTISLSGEATYYIQVSDDWCSDVDSVRVGFLVLAGTPQITTPLCHDDCNGSASITIMSGNPPYAYLWNTGDTTNALAGLCAGTYTVTITDLTNCLSIQTLNLTNPTVITPTMTPENIPCVEACVGTITAGASGSTPPYTYQWSNGQTTHTATGLCQGEFAVTITDSHNCHAYDSSQIVVDYIFANMQVWTSDDTIFQGQSANLFATPISNCVYVWTPGESVANNGSANVMVNPSTTTTYFVMVQDPNGCRTFDTITIYVIDVFCEEPFVFVPNAFTPDGDNQNDLFNVQTHQGSKIYLAVFDRWGEKMFETLDLNTSWDGTFRGKPCDPGVFVYYCEVICYNNKMWSKKGNVTLIR